MKTIGEQIAEVRTALGWTRRKLAEKCTYTEMSIWRWENGKRKPSERAIKTLEKAMGTKLGEGK